MYVLAQKVSLIYKYQFRIITPNRIVTSQQANCNFVYVIVSSIYVTLSAMEGKLNLIQKNYDPILVY